MNLHSVDAQPDLDDVPGILFYLTKEMDVEQDLLDVPLSNDDFKISVTNDSVSNRNQAYESNIF